MSGLAAADRLDLLGSAVGTFLVLAALGGLLGMPWQTNPDSLAVAAQLVGLVLSGVVGVALVRVVRSG